MWSEKSSQIMESSSLLAGDVNADLGSSGGSLATTTINSQGWILSHYLHSLQYVRPYPLVAKVTVPPQVSQQPVIYPRGPNSTGRNSQIKRSEALIPISLKPNSPLSSLLTKQARRQGGGSRGSSKPPFWPPRDFIYTAIVYFKCLPAGPKISIF